MKLNIRSRLLITGLVLCLFLTSFTGCSKKNKTIDTLIIGTTAEILTSNRSEYNFDVISGTLSQGALVSVDENGEYQPMLATYETNDSKTWTFTLKDKLKWHDDTPLTTEDIKFTLEYLAKQNDGGFAESYEAINIIDEKVIELVLPSPNVRALSSLTTMRLLPKHIYDGVDDMTTVANEKANIGCGPYKYVSFNPDSGVIEFTANTDYIDGTPNVTNVIIKTYSNADTMYMALKNNEIDMIYIYSNGIDTTVIEDLKASDNITLKPIKDLSNTAVFVFNNNTEPGSNLFIRKAVSKAIDYDKFREIFGTEYSTKSTAGFVPTGTIGYIDSEINSRDLDAAKKYLQEAGAIDTDGDGVVEYKGQPLVIELLLRSDKALYERYGELLQANLLEAGIKVELVFKEVAEFRSISEKEHTNKAMVTKFTAFGMGMSSGMGSAYLDGRQKSNAQGQIMDAEFSVIVDSMKNSTSMDEYLKAASDCQQYYAKNVPAIALYWDSYVQAYNKSLDGFKIDGTFGLLNFNTWYSITKSK